MSKQMSTNYLDYFTKASLSPGTLTRPLPWELSASLSAWSTSLTPSSPTSTETESWPMTRFNAKIFDRLLIRIKCSAAAYYPHVDFHQRINPNFHLNKCGILCIHMLVINQNYNVYLPFNVSYLLHFMH